MRPIAGGASGARTLVVESPAIAREWHPTRNGSLGPRNVLAGSCKHVWWKCAKGPDHEWRATPAKRARAGQGCPFCAGNRVSATNSLTVRSPTGYYYTITWAGTFPDQQIYYSNGGCTGSMYLNAGTTNLSYRYTKFLVYEGKTGNFFVPAGGDANGLASNVAFTAPSIWNSSGGVWQCAR